MEKKFELLCFIKKDCNKGKIIKQINEFITELGGTAFYTEDMGLRNLAYEVKGHKKAYFYLANFKATESNKNIDGRLSVKINTVEEIIKHMIIPSNEEE